MSADIVRSHLRHGEFALAIVAARSALNTAERQEEPELWALLARALCRVGDPRDARRCADLAREGIVEPASWEIALACGETALATGEPFVARALLSEALAAHHVEPHVIGEGSAEQAVAIAMHERASAEIWLGVCLAEACRAAGEPEQGIAVATRALVLAERTFGSRAIEAADAWLALAGCRHAAGLDEAARADLQRCLRIRREVQPDHPDLAATLDLMGVVLRGLNQPHEAIACHREALELWSRRVGARSGPVGACKHALAQALHRTGDFVGARAEMQDAVAITGRTLGADHVDTHIARFELGRFEMDCGQVEEGLSAMEAARAVVADRLGAQHPVVRSMNRWL